MRVDIIIPQKREEDFYKLALKLGYDALIVLGETAHKPPKGLSVVTGELINPEKYSRRAKGLSFVEEGGRHEFEKLCPKVIFNVEYSPKRDKTHFRLSGMDDVSCRLAKQHNIILGFGVGRLLSADKGVILGRIMQNIRFCRKYGVQMVLASFARRPEEMRSPHDLKALGISLGMTPQEADNAVLSELLS